ncbi:MAG: glycerophosphodiester phosphodiesterase [Acidobacteria bacterium]|nr:glycerophosphodiester phosphodiesterase [Acidobacteriota bacterium]
MNGTIPKTQAFIIIGHRGAMAVYPENSLEGFRYLLENGIEWAETDLRVNRHGEIVLHHDVVSRRMVPVRFSGRELNALSLEALLNTLPKLKLNLEIKSHGVMEHLNDIPHLKETPDRFIFSSFHHSLVTQLKEAYPRIPGLLLMEGAPENLCGYVENSGADGLVFQHEFYDPKEIACLVSAGKTVFSYSVDLVEEAVLFKKMGLSGIISNHPVRIRDRLRLAESSFPFSPKYE